MLNWSAHSDYLARALSVANYCLLLLEDNNSDSTNLIIGEELFNPELISDQGLHAD